jgi:hypothetical protein
VKKKWILISIILLGLVIILGAVAYSTFVLGNPDLDNFLGLRKIIIQQKLDGSSLILIKCTSLSGYTVSSVDADEVAYRGERAHPINDDLGQFVIKVTLQDTNVAPRFYKRFDTWTTYRLDGTNISFMYVCNPDHGVNIYFGSNEPISDDKIVIRYL